MQIVLILVAMALGLSISYYTDGFKFSGAVCLIAGLFLVTPSLFKFHLKDFKIIKDHKPALIHNLAINFFALPIIAIIIGYLIQDIGIGASLFLLSLLPGGGMVMNWINKSGANVKVGFVMFFINLSLLFLSFFLFDLFGKIAPNYYLTENFISQNITIPPFAPFVILIIIPLLVSRIILESAPKLVTLVESHRPFIANVTIFGIVFYLFGLESSKMLFHIEIMTLLKAFAGTLIFYFFAYLIANKFLSHNKDDEAVFWHVITRYITLALIIASFSTPIYGASFILPIMFAYFIQILMAMYISKVREKV